VTKQPETIHDFYGFPKALFDVQYPAPGEPRLARLTAELLMAESVGLDPERGLDHGAWSVLIAMYPQANIPVVQLSLDTTRLGSFHYNIAKKLAPLRDEGVLIVASGNIVHNLPLFNYHDPTPLDWAVDFDNDIKRRIAARDHEALISRDSLGPSTNLAIPTPEHYLPLLYAIALQDKDEPLCFFNGAVVSSIAMTSIVIGNIADP
jgi:4,5-DOPA dioxygenase extradiol